MSRPLTDGDEELCSRSLEARDTQPIGKSGCSSGECPWSCGPPILMKDPPCEAGNIAGSRLRVGFLHVPEKPAGSGLPAILPAPQDEPKAGLSTERSAPEFSHRLYTKEPYSYSRASTSGLRTADSAGPSADRRAEIRITGINNATIPNGYSYASRNPAMSRSPISRT
jgi:hypothetical protein